MDLLLRELANDDPTLLWIVDYIGNEIDEGKHWNITDNLKEFAGNIHNETYQQQSDTLRTQLQDASIITTLRKQLKDELAVSRQRIDSKVEEFFEILKQNGLTVDDFSYNTSGVCGYYLKLQGGDYNTTFTARTTASSASTMSNPQ